MLISRVIFFTYSLASTLLFIETRYTRFRTLMCITLSLAPMEPRGSLKSNSLDLTFFFRVLFRK